MEHSKQGRADAAASATFFVPRGRPWVGFNRLLGTLLPNRGGRSVDELAERIGLSVEALQAFQPAYREAFIPKRSGGQRRLLVPDERTKAFQRILLRRVLGRLRAHDAACGFEPAGRSSTMPGRTPGRRSSSGWTWSTSFPPRAAIGLEAYFRSIGWSTAAAGLLVRLTTHDGGLPQGSPDQPQAVEPGQSDDGRAADEDGHQVQGQLYPLCRRPDVFISQGLPPPHPGIDPTGPANPQGPGLHRCTAARS